MKKISVRLLRSGRVARDTMSFYFDLPGNHLGFLPGQFVTLSLSGSKGLDEKERSRIFSIASAPEEPHLMVATRMTGSGFQNALAAMQPDDLAQIEGPDGKLVFEPDASIPLVCLTAGMGITPFRSLLHSAVKRRLPRPIQLVYSNRTPEDAAFLEELENWADELQNFRLLATMTQPEKSSQPWNGRKGRVDSAFLKQHVQDLDRAECYIAGPPDFVKRMKESLKDAGVPPERIRTE